MRFAHIASRAFDRPLLLEPRRGHLFLSTLAGHIARSNLLDARLDIERPTPQAYDDDGPRRQPTSSLPLGLVEWQRGKCFAQVDRVAVLEVDGTLVNKNGSLQPYCGMTGYDGLRTQLIAAMRDPEVRGVALYVESPGGEVAGCFDLANFIRDAAAEKPIWAIVDGMAASAAYALSSGCTRITTSSVGLVGSIGVIVAHADFSKMLKEDGIDVSLIFAGEHKADGNPYEPLPKAVRAKIQAEVDGIWDQFADLVAQGRGMASAKVKGLEAECFMGADAVAQKLADAVMPPDESLIEFIQSVSKL